MQDKWEGQAIVGAGGLRAGRWQKVVLSSRKYLDFPCKVLLVGPPNMGTCIRKTMWAQCDDIDEDLSGLSKLSFVGESTVMPT